MIDWNTELRDCAISKDLNRAFHVDSDNKDLVLRRDQLLLLSFVLLHDCLRCHSNCPIPVSEERYNLRSDYVQGTHEIAGLYCQNNITDNELNQFWNHYDLKENRPGGHYVIRDVREKTAQLKGRQKKIYAYLKSGFCKLLLVPPLVHILDSSIPLQTVIDDFFALIAGLIEQLKLNDYDSYSVLIDMCELKERTLPCFTQSKIHPSYSLYDVLSFIKNSYLFCLVPWVIALFSHFPWDLNDHKSMELFKEIWRYCGFQDQRRTDQLLYIAKLSLSALIMIGRRIDRKDLGFDFDDEYHEFLSHVQRLLSNGFVECNKHSSGHHRNCSEEQKEDQQQQQLCGKCLINKAKVMSYPVRKYDIAEMPRDDIELNDQFFTKIKIESNRIKMIKINERFLNFASWLNYEVVSYPILTAGNFRVLLCFTIVEVVLMIRILI